MKPQNHTENVGFMKIHLNKTSGARWPLAGFSAMSFGSLNKTLTPETNFIVFSNGDIRLLNWMMNRMAALKPSTLNANKQPFPLEMW